MKSLAAIALLAFAIAGPLHADELDACMQQAGSTMAMDDCISTAMRVQDKRLNDAYRNLRTALSPTQRAALERAERDWIRFRDSNCALRLDLSGGTSARIAAGDCMLRMTRARAEELESLQQAP